MSGCLMDLRAQLVERALIQRMDGAQCLGISCGISLRERIDAPDVEWAARHAKGVAPARGAHAQPARCAFAVARIVERAPQTAGLSAHPLFRQNARGAQVVQEGGKDLFVRILYWRWSSHIQTTHGRASCGVSVTPCASGGIASRTRWDEGAGGAHGAGPVKRSTARSQAVCSLPR